MACRKIRWSFAVICAHRFAIKQTSTTAPGASNGCTAQSRNSRRRPTKISVPHQDCGFNIFLYFQCSPDRKESTADSDRDRAALQYVVKKQKRLFDHCIGEGDKLLRNFNAKDFGGRADPEFERWPLERISEGLIPGGSCEPHPRRGKPWYGPR